MDIVLTVLKVIGLILLVLLVILLFLLLIALFVPFRYSASASYDDPVPHDDWTASLKRKRRKRNPGRKRNRPPDQRKACWTVWKRFRTK